MINKGFLKVPMTQGMYFLIDPIDEKTILRHKWRAHKSPNNFYAVTTISRKPTKMIYAHNLIMLSKGIDHIDGDGLNNSRSNLRKCTQSENIANSRKFVKSSSQFKGVDFDKSRKKWRARIVKNRKEFHLGYFKSEEDAAKAYDKKAVDFFGNFSRTNFKK